MTELQLTRTPGDRRSYAVPGVGTLRFSRRSRRAASAETADGRRWELARRGVWRRSVEATDPSGTTVGRFAARRMRRGGTLQWRERDLVLRPASRWRERYALADGDRELAVFDGRSWGRRPVKVVVEDERLDPGLLLFAAFVVRGLANDAAGAAG